MKKNVLIILTIATLAFIWIHSAMSPADSNAESSAVRDFIAPFLELFVGKGNVTDHLVRKLAHFTEYAVYGIELSLLIVSNWMKWKSGKIFTKILICLNIILVTAFIDETIQFFSSRGPAVLDIWIDLAGGALTTCLVAIGTSASKRRKV